MVRKFVIALSLGTASLALSTPAAAQAEEAVAVDPAKLKLAETMAGKIIPPGSYQKMMKTMADQMADGMIAQMLGTDASVFAQAAGEDNASVEGKSLGDLAAEVDPHFKERMDITMKVMFEEMGTLMSAMEPSARGALASVYARKYTMPQLKDINAFFATPSGSAFAADFMATFTDKEMMTAMMGEMPKVLEAMPAIMKKVEEATAHLPPPPKAAGSSEMNPDCALDGDDSDCSAEDKERLAAIAAGEAAVEAAAEAAQALAREGWSKADLRAVEKIEAEQEKLWARYNTAETALNDSNDRLQAAIDAANRNSGQPTNDEIMAAEDIPADAVPPPAIPK